MVELQTNDSQPRRLPVSGYITYAVPAVHIRDFERDGLPQIMGVFERFGITYHVNRQPPPLETRVAVAMAANQETMQQSARTNKRMRGAVGFGIVGLLFGILALFGMPAGGILALVFIVAAVVLGVMAYAS